jgi:entericidin A
MFKKLTALACAAGVFLLAGCNTMEGLGKDVSKLGNKIEKKAEESKR